MHSTTGITDQFYSNIDDEMKRNRIDSMFGKNDGKERANSDFEEILEYLDWKKKR